MSLTTRVRFLAPLDPRMIWAKVQELLDAPPDYRYDHNPPGTRPLYEGDFWPLNGELYSATDQGLIAHAILEYGHEAAPLREEWDIHPEYAEDYPVEKRPAISYAELALDTGYSDDYHAGDIHAGIIARLAEWSPVPIIWKLEHTGEWFDVGQLHRLGRVST